MGSSPRPAVEPLGSVHTANLPGILGELGISLLVSTYQTGKVIAVGRDGDRLNTHFRSFAQPMGLAYRAGRLAVGTRGAVLELGNAPALAPRLDPPGRHDACFLLRRTHVTGNIDVHELAWGGDGELWIVNTRFSCLCTLDGEHSFVPRWRPRFVSGYAVEDRCHLNGLGMRDGRPHYATALGRSDTARGWREGRARGGLVMDVASGEVVCEGLSMPHSPRWHAGELWILESGDGSLGRVDLGRGRYEKLVELPGFTRGLAFHGPLAFVGLSQVRESNVFGGLPLTERMGPAERVCGVWVVDVRRGVVLGFVRFEDAVQEIFAVEVLPGILRPELTPDDAQLVESTYVLPDAALRELQERQEKD